MDILIRWLADGSLILVVLIGIAAVLIANRPSRWLARLPFGIMAGLTALLVGKLMSLLYQPAVARPFIELGVTPGAAYIDNPGFPSDHALLAGVVVLAVAFLTPYKKLAFVIALLTILMGAARVLALVHTPLDVIGGFAAACVGALWYLSARR